MSLFVVLVVCVATLGTVGQASITVTAAAAAAAATVPERQMSLLNIDSIATSSMTAAATTTDLGEETIMDEEVSNYCIWSIKLYKHVHINTNQFGSLGFFSRFSNRF